jgi:biotin synthase
MDFRRVSKSEKIEILKSTDKSIEEELFKAAYDTKLENVGNTVYFRGIVELSNICNKNCYYCGIRKDNKNTKRYMMSDTEIITSGKWAFDAGYGSIVLQSGEREDSFFADFIENILIRLKTLTDNKLGITLSLGEQSYETYKRWFAAGGHRYLLRIETSNRELYKKLHPENHSFDRRMDCLKTLRDTGYQVGTGVMIGLPYQSEEDLVNDIEFFKEMKIDMIGMGPYIEHIDTPLGKSSRSDKEIYDKRLKLALKMIALTRLELPDINIAATTALQGLDPFGRELGLKAGANIIMPNITPVQYRENYKLYDNKPCTDENAEDCIRCLENRIRLIGENIGYNKWGDSPHFFK